ncbi:SMP-30/gluconolactonase/LRE family protein [Aurantiacibacter odishensis]|uniref:SMP-30/gluconolactonase/LRE family protein n=1 Tax=Aurantiacibacter odishensis TaxID=1155476 RepID=UPI000E768C5F|nr:hypothetical protein [Aurantiacibacter odishensis]
MRKIVRCNMMIAALTFVLAACATPASSEKPPSEARVPWHPVDARTGAITDVADLESLAQAFPNSSSVRLRLLNAYVASGQNAQATVVAEGLVLDGYAFSPGAMDYLKGLFATGSVPSWFVMNDENAAPLPASEIVATIPEKAKLPEGLSVVADGLFAVTTVVSRELWLRGEESWSAVPLPDAGNLSGIASDASGLVVASADLGMVPPGEEAFSGLIAMEERNYAVSMPAPEGVNLSDLTFVRDQTIYASDPAGGGVYRSEAIGSALTALVPPGTLRSPQGIAPSEDGARLYVSDYRYGLAAIDSATGQVSRLTADTPMLLDGIDGLWLHEGELIAIQNGLSPRRIVALRLSEDGNRITGMRVLERANPDWTEPLGGDIHEGALYYIGNGSWDLFEEGGTLKEGAELRPTHIRRLELREKPTD